MNALRNRQPAVGLVLTVGAGLLALALTRGFEFLAGISIIFIAVNVAMSVNLHFFVPRGASTPAVKSYIPFRFRANEEAIISIVFALAGIASLTGILHTSSLAGWLAMGAAGTGAANIVVIRLRSMETVRRPRV